MTATIVAVSDSLLTDGYRVLIEPDLSNISGLDKPVPVAIDHDRSVKSIIGIATGFSYELQSDGSAALIARIQLMADRPEAVEAWPLIESGVGSWSIGFEPLDYGDESSGSTVVREWRLLEISLVTVAADPAAVTRDHKRAELIRGMVSRSGQPIELAEKLIRSGATPEQARDAILEAKAAAAPRIDNSIDVTRDYGNQRSPIDRALTRAFAGQESLAWGLKAAGVQGRTPAQIIQRAMSTSDLPALLEASGDRILQQRFSAPARGILRIAQVRPLNDYREASTVAVGLVGEAQPINQGGEVQFSYVEDSVARYQPRRVGLGLIATPESIANDDLAGLQRGFEELADSCLSAEAKALVELLEGTPTGAIAPDGSALFAPAHLNENSDESGVTLPALGEAVALLRKQTSVGGRLLDQEPGLILAAPDSELGIRQLLAALETQTRDEFNPWAGLEIAIDARLSGAYFYLVARGNLPLELGRLTPAPQLTSEVQFTTGCFRSKAEHAFGCVVADHRSIVRVSTVTTTP